MDMRIKGKPPTAQTGGRRLCGEREISGCGECDYFAVGTFTGTTYCTRTGRIEKANMISIYCPLRKVAGT